MTYLRLIGCVVALVGAMLVHASFHAGNYSSPSEEALHRLRALGATVDIGADGTAIVLVMNRWTGADADLAQVRLISNVRRVSLRSKRLTDDALLHLGGVDTLEDIDLIGPTFTSLSLRRLSNFSHLRKLSVGGEGFTEESLLLIGKLHNLRELRISGALSDKTSIAGSSLPALADLKHLKSLTLPSGVTDETLELLPPLPALTYLRLENAFSVNGNSLECLSNLKSLECVDLYTTAVSDRNLSALSQCERLQELIAPVCTSDAGVKEIAHCPSIERLCLRRTRVTSACGVWLEAIPNLRRLDLSETEIDDHILPQLVRHAHLSHLDVSGTFVSPESARHARVNSSKLELVTDRIIRPPTTGHLDAVARLRELGAIIRHHQNSKKRTTTVSLTEEWKGCVDDLNHFDRLDGIDRIFVSPQIDHRVALAIDNNPRWHQYHQMRHRH